MGLNIQDLRITSTDFDNGHRLNRVHAFENGNVIPRFRILGVPTNAAEIVVICHDPDAPLPHGFTHWTLYGLPPTPTDLGPDADAVFRPGPNDTGNSGYFGPMPPEGHGPHHYYFCVYAVDVPVEGSPTRSEFLSRYGDNIIEQNRIVGIYES
jgi:Raf kinase inhibitor-like YbhB/YbcL family protein